LYRDILSRLRDWQICASIDGTGPIGEYIRTGLKYNKWLENFDQGVEAQVHSRQLRIDFTLTLPGLFEVKNIQALAKEKNVGILAKVIFSFTPDIILSPLALPKEILHPWLDELITSSEGAMRDVLIQLKTRPTFEEQWPDTYKESLAQGKSRVLQLETIRKDKYTLADILSERPEALKWYEAIS
jgi:hypothetical protein